MHSLRAWFSRHLIALALVWAVFSIAAALIIAADGLLRPDLSGDAPPAAALPAEPVQSPQLT